MTQDRDKDARDNPVTVRLSDEELVKLDAIAEATERDRSKVLRWLLANAEWPECQEDAA